MMGSCTDIESSGKKKIHPGDANPEVYSLPVLTLDVGEMPEGITEKELHANILAFLDQNPGLREKINSEKLDVVAHATKNIDGKIKWAIIIGFGFAALGLGVAGYRLIKRHPKEIKLQD